MWLCYSRSWSGDLLECKLNSYVSIQGQIRMFLSRDKFVCFYPGTNSYVSIQGQMTDPRLTLQNRRISNSEERSSLRV